MKDNQPSKEMQQKIKTTANLDSDKDLKLEFENTYTDSKLKDLEEKRMRKEDRKHIECPLSESELEGIRQAKEGIGTYYTDEERRKLWKI